MWGWHVKQDSLFFWLNFSSLVVTDGKERTSPHQRLRTFSRWFRAFWRRMSTVLKWKVTTLMSIIVPGEMLHCVFTDLIGMDSVCLAYSLCVCNWLVWTGHEGRIGMAAVILTEGEDFDCSGTYKQVVSYLPAYARPRFIRIQVKTKKRICWAHLCFLLQPEHETECWVVPRILLNLLTHFRSLPETRLAGWVWFWLDALF